MRRDPRLGALIKRVGRCASAGRRTASRSPALVRAILSQQLSGKAADTILRPRRRARRRPRRPDAGGLLAVDPDSAARRRRQPAEDLVPPRSRRARARRPARSRTRSSASPTKRSSTAITAVKGLGRWSAEMFLMFRLNRPDVFPVGDLGIVKGVQKLLGMRRPPRRRTMMRPPKPWRPYRSVAAWYLWRI